MPNVRPLNIKKYGISKNKFLTARYYCLQYDELKAELKRQNTEVKAHRLDRVKGQKGSSPNRTTEESAVRMAEIRQKLEIIEGVAKEVTRNEPKLTKYLIRYVTEEGCTFAMLQQNGIPCGKNLFYSLRRRFYYELSKRI